MYSSRSITISLSSRLVKYRLRFFFLFFFLLINNIDVFLGTYAYTDGVPSCSPCPTGWYTTQTGAVLCSICPEVSAFILDLGWKKKHRS